MRKALMILLTAAAGVTLSLPVAAQQQAGTNSPVRPLVQLLQSKGILTAQEAAEVSQASSSNEANQRLAALLVSKGLITQQEYNQTVQAFVVPTAANTSSDASLVPAVIRIRSGASPNSANSPADSTTPPAKEPGVIPAVAPLRVLPIGIPKQGGLLPDITLGSGAKLQIYGFFKASAVEDTASSGGTIFGSNDFPLPLLLGDTGPNPSPQIHVKARSFRAGSNFEWVPKGTDVTLTGKLEFDFEGDYTNVNNRNISGFRSSTPSIRLAWVRLDTKLGGSLPWFAEFGQDWTILGSSTLPSLFETTGLGIGMGSFYERLPQFKTGVQFHTGDLKIEPEVAMVLPMAGSPALTDEQRTRFGDQAGPESNQPGIQGRLVFDFPLSKGWQGVAPTEIIFSGGHARFAETVLGSAVPAAALAAFPTGFQETVPQNIWTSEIQLPTPWVTLVAKYYRGGDMREYFAGQLNDEFFDTMGFAGCSGSVTVNCIVGTADSVNNRGIPILNVNGTIVPAAVRPVYGQGGFGELSFPLGRIFHADPEGRSAGWVFHVGFGTDRVTATDARRSNGLVRTDLGTGSLTYKLNKWVSFINEVSYIDTRAANNGGKVFRGVPATQAHAWRNEFGTVFTF